MIRRLCALAWFVGAMAMVLVAVYAWGFIVVSAAQVWWPIGAGVAVCTLMAMPYGERYLIYPWQKWFEAWQWFDATVFADRNDIARTPED